MKEESGGGGGKNRGRGAEKVKCIGAGVRLCAPQGEGGGPAGPETLTLACDGAVLNPTCLASV